jgi:2-keto-4-pentenoate hydratase/2-oxohepta-3-ene-1,7-dioic acid hydratase in catechol pathway
MTRHVRFTLDRNTPPAISDASPQVLYGVLDADTVYESGSPWSAERLASHPLVDVRLLPPCWPSKIVCVGRNYVDHVKEMGSPMPAEPLIFMKPPSSLIAHGDAIVYPRISATVHHEGELGVVIGERARNVAAADWERYVWGYTCVNDVTARDLQKKDGQWTRGKGFDTFCPLGPWIVPRAEVDLSRVRVRSFVDDEKRQDAPVTDMIFSLGVIVEFVTQFMTLEPGDLIATGTPPGVGPVVAGNTVRVVVEGVGELVNGVTQG